MNGIIQECRESPSLTVIVIACVAATIGWAVLLAKVLL
jgi:hypothetical protein